MLFNILQAAAPTGIVYTPKSKAVHIKVDRLDDSNSANFEPWFDSFVAVRYPTNGDAVADTNGVEVARSRNAKFIDNEELTRGTWHYRIFWRDIYDNKSALSAVAAVTYRGTNTGDVDDGAVTDRKRRRRDDSNMVSNADCDDAGMWAGTTALTSVPTTASWASQSFISAAAGTAQCDIDSGISGAADIPVRSGRKYYVSAIIGTTSATTVTCELYLQTFTMDAAGVTTLLSSHLVGTYTGTGQGAINGIVTVGGTARRARLKARKLVSGVAATNIIGEPDVHLATQTEIIADGAITDPKADQTAPGTPTGLAVTQLTKDTDGGDGRVRINARVTWNAPAGGVPVRRYIIEVNDGENDETYYCNATRRRIKLKDMVVGRTYNVVVSAESFAGIEGAQTSSVPITPTAKTAAPGDVTSVSIVTKATFNRIKFTAPADKDIAGFNIYANTVANPATATLLDFTRATKYDDTTVRARNTLTYYYVEAVNRSGVVAATRVAASNNPATSRGVSSSETNMTDPNSYAENSDFQLGPNIGWSSPAQIISDVANAYKGTYVLARAYTGAASNYVNRNSLLFAVRTGEQYLIGGMIKTDGSAAMTYAGYRLSFTDAAGTEIATGALALLTVANTSWIEYSGRVAVPATAGIVYARIEPVIIGQTAGTIYFSHVFVRPVVTEVMSDQTAPAAPAAPVMTVLTADFDKDGKMDNGFFMNLPAVVSGVPVKFWEIEIQEATAQGSSGSMTGYSKRGKNQTVKTEPSGTTYFQFEGKANRWYKTRVRGISFSGKEGGWSVYQNLGAQPTAYDGMVGTTPATPTAIAVDNGIEVTWTQPSISANPTYSHTELLQGVTVIYSGRATKFLDKTVRTPGVGYQYTIKHYDRAGAVSNSSAASASVNYRQVQTAEIGNDQITPIKANLGVQSNLVRDNQQLDISLSSASGGTGPALSSFPNDAATLGASTNFYRVTSSLAIGQQLTYTGPLSPCFGSRRITFGLKIRRILPAASHSVTLFVDWYTLDSSGVAVFSATDAVSVSRTLTVSPTVYTPIVTLTSPANAAYFRMRVVTAAAAAAATYTFEVGGFYAIEATSSIVEESSIVGAVSIAAGSLLRLMGHTSNFTQACKGVLVTAGFQMTSGGSRNIGVYFCKGTLGSPSVVWYTTIESNSSWQRTFYFDMTGNTLDSQEFEIWIETSASAVQFDELYLLTDARLG